MDDRLEGFINKLNRAETHFGHVRESVRTFGASGFYESVTALDYRGRLVDRARNVKRPGPELAVLIGDCVYNYRSALDHLAYALAAGYTDPLPKNLAASSAFPIFDSGEKFKRRGPGGGAWKMRGMSRSARASIRRLQPYHRRKRPELRPLWMLEELCNLDKHRLLHLTGAYPVGASFEVGGTGGFQIDPGAIEAWVGPIEEGTPLTRVTGQFDSLNDMYVKAHVTADVAFDKRSQATSVRGLSVIGVLDAIRRTIRVAVLPELRPELVRRFPEA